MLDTRFPGLKKHGYIETSTATVFYNCIAWVVDDPTRWWWPESDASYWPPNCVKEVTLAAFVAMFESLGYSVSKNSNLEKGFEKVAIFVKGTEPSHAAKQLSDGWWSSKLGDQIDISHRLKGLEGAIYGRVEQVLKRPLKER